MTVVASMRQSPKGSEDLLVKDVSGGGPATALQVRSLNLWVALWRCVSLLSSSGHYTASTFAGFGAASPQNIMPCSVGL